MEDSTLGDEWGFKLRGDKHFAMEKNPLRFLPCFDQREPDKAVKKGGMDAAPASIASSTESTTQQNRFFVSLDEGFMEQIISVTKYLKC